MGAFVVVELDVVAYSLTQLHDRVGRIDRDVFLLDSAPEPLYPDVVLAAAPAIHADEDAVLFQEVPCLCCMIYIILRLRQSSVIAEKVWIALSHFNIC